MTGLLFSLIGLLYRMSDYYAMPYFSGSESLAVASVAHSFTFKYVLSPQGNALLIATNPYTPDGEATSHGILIARNCLQGSAR